MSYDEAKALVMDKLRGKEVDKDKLLQALKEYPTIGKRMRAAWNYFTTFVENEEIELED
jgi:hypothetical protein